MNENIKQFERQSHLDVYGLGLDRMKWEEALQRYTDLIVNECADVLIKWKDEPFPYDPEFGARLIKDHFGVNNE